MDVQDLSMLHLAKGRLDGGASQVWAYVHEDRVRAFWFFKGHTNSPFDADPDFVLPLPDYTVVDQMEFMCGANTYKTTYTPPDDDDDDNTHHIRVDSLACPEVYAEYTC